jgi:hypothetical protein
MNGGISLCDMSPFRRAILISQFDERAGKHSLPGAHGYDAVSSAAAIEVIARWFTHINSAE